MVSQKRKLATCGGETRTELCCSSHYVTVVGPPLATDAREQPVHLDDPILGSAVTFFGGPTCLIPVSRALPFPFDGHANARTSATVTLSGGDAPTRPIVADQVARKTASLTGLATHWFTRLRPRIMDTHDVLPRGLYCAVERAG